VNLPPLDHFQMDGMHRLIPSLYSENQTVLAEVASDEEMLDDITLLDGATNERIQTENGGKIGISTLELVYGIPNAHIVNAAFSYTSDAGSRFNDHTRGAWYAADELETSLAEVTYHKAKRLADIVVPELPGERPDRDVSTYDDWMADFRSAFHRIERSARYEEYLQPEPVPQCYAASQLLARTLISRGSPGMIYPSVRRLGHLCIVCFRPAMVYNPHRDLRVEVTLFMVEDRYEVQFRTVVIQ
jgi:RES domain